MKLNISMFMKKTKTKLLLRWELSLGLRFKKLFLVLETISVVLTFG